MSNCILGWPNAFTYATLSASAAEAALPVTNLANDQGAASQAWQCPSVSGSLELDPLAAVAWRMISLHRTNLTPAALIRVRIWPGSDTSASTVYDSTTINAGVQAGYGQAILVLSTPVTGRKLRIEIADPTNPDGHLNIPLGFAGPGWQPARNFDYQSAPGRTDQRTKVQTRAGGVVIRPDWVKRVFDMSLSGVKAAEVWPKLMDIDLWARRGNNVLFVPNPASATLAAEALFGEFEPAGNVTYPNKSADARGYRATITERL